MGRFVSEVGKRFLVARKTMPALRLSAMRDVIGVLRDTGVYDMCTHNRSSHTLVYPPLGNELVFAPVDDPRKFRGPEWNYAWLNEANEFEFEDFQQINLRLSNRSVDGRPNQLFLDFNPDDPGTWIKTELEDKGRCETIRSTYRDNSFLSPEVIAEIEYLEHTDPNFWNIYGLGEYGTRTKGIIYTAWTVLGSADRPPEYDAAEPIYGLDFGYNNPSALVEVRHVHAAGPEQPAALYVRELLYQNGLTNSQLIELLKDLVPDRRAYIYADPAEPARIEEIFQAGFLNIQRADKAVKTGIDFVKRYSLRIIAGAENLVRELRGYKWREDLHGNPLDEPVKFRDHAVDAMRYAAYTHGMAHWLASSSTLRLPARHARHAQPGPAESTGALPERTRRRSRTLDGF